ncbi:MAG: hypothetical protein FWE53_01380 [Firmicutes bacterium]|nr:hypothetical protein [Bacillota bacterium]
MLRNKNITSAKSVLTIAGACITALVVSLGITLAFFFTSLNNDGNGNIARIQFKAYSGTTTKTELTSLNPLFFTTGFGGSLTTPAANISIKNESNIPIVMRATVVCEWWNATGKLASNANNNFIGFNLGVLPDFIKMENGWWYYNKALMPNTDEFVTFFNSVSLPALVFGATRLRVFLIIEGMQQEHSDINTGFIRAWSPGGTTTNTLSLDSGLGVTMPMPPATGGTMPTVGVSLNSLHSNGGFLYFLVPSTTPPATGGWATVPTTNQPTPSNSLMTAAYNSTMPPTTYQFALLGANAGNTLRIYNNSRVSIAVSALVVLEWYEHTGGTTYVRSNDLTLNTDDVTIRLAAAGGGNQGSWMNIDSRDAGNEMYYTGGKPQKAFAYSMPVAALSYVDFVTNSITIASQNIVPPTGRTLHLRMSVQVTGIERSQFPLDQVKEESGYLQLYDYANFSPGAKSTLTNNLQSPYRTWLEEPSIGGLVTVTLIWDDLLNLAVLGLNPAARYIPAAGFTASSFKIKKGELFHMPGGVVQNGAPAPNLHNWKWRIGSASGPELAMSPGTTRSAAGIQNNITLYFSPT